ncbi:MAG: MFS transporter [Anaerolineae bacterium]
MANRSDSNAMTTRIADSMGVNRVVLTLSIARLADALGNSVLFIVIPLYVARLPAPWFPLPDSVRVGLLISLYGLVNSAFQPIMGALSDRMSRRKPFILGGLILMGFGTFAFAFAGRFTGWTRCRPASRPKRQDHFGSLIVNSWPAASLGWVLPLF